MSLRRKIKTAMAIYDSAGVNGLLNVLRQKGVPIPQSQKAKWKDGIRSEVEFWDDFVRTGGGSEWAGNYQRNVDPHSRLQPRPAELLPATDDLHILDVGAGPFTCLGKMLDNKRIKITAVDPLADEYAAILSKYQVQPLVKTERLAGEELTTRFAPNTFDLVYARNCIDHSYDPERAILEMVAVVKRGCYVLLEHRPNVAELENYQGLHQWNFSMNELGDFNVRSVGSAVNMTTKYTKQFRTTCELLTNDGVEFLITRIQKI